MGTWRELVGVGRQTATLTDTAVSALGGFVSLLLLLLVTKSTLGLEARSMIIGSTGASAVLLFAVPHGPLSQPWAVIGGHFLSAVIGVTCARWFDSIEVAAGLAVGLSIGVMGLSKCTHPPGGATALTAVIGGESIHELGYGFVLKPVMLNAAIMLIVAVVFNACFPWRRYPAALARRTTPPANDLPPSN